MRFMKPLQRPLDQLKHGDLSKLRSLCFHRYWTPLWSSQQTSPTPQLRPGLGQNVFSFSNKRPVNEIFCLFLSQTALWRSAIAINVKPKIKLRLHQLELLNTQRGKQSRAGRSFADITLMIPVMKLYHPAVRGCQLVELARAKTCFCLIQIRSKLN